MSDSNNTKIKKWYRLNFLKMKAGADLNDEARGYIDPSAVKKAQHVIDDEEKSYYEEIEGLIVSLESSWDDLQRADDDKRIKSAQREMMNFANIIKDIAYTYGYTLMGDFGDSLCNFCKKLDMAREEHKPIIEAHLSVIRATFKTHIKESEGEQAEELKRLLVLAIEKHTA